MVSIHIVLYLLADTGAGLGGGHGCAARMSRGRYGMLARALWHAREGVMTCCWHQQKLRW